MPLIQFTSTDMIYLHSARPKEVSADYAAQMVKLGKARYINEPSIPIMQKVEKEEGNVYGTYVAWCGVEGDEGVCSSADLCGFVLSRVCDEGGYSRLVLSDIVVIDTSIQEPEHWLRFGIFERDLPFVFYATSMLPDDVWAYQVLARSLFQNYISEELRMEYQRVFGQLVRDYWTLKGESFWRKIDQKIRIV